MDSSDGRWTMDGGTRYKPLRGARPSIVHRPSSALTPSSAPTYTGRMIRLAAVSDIHFKVGDQQAIAARFDGVREKADLLLLPGDLTDNGTLQEGEQLGRELSRLGIPVLGVLGNHDFASRMHAELIRVLGGAGISVLDGETAEFAFRGETVGVIGTRGFRGGFDGQALSETSEPEVEVWVATAGAEADKIERGLERLRTHYRIVMTHYSPIRATVEGEHPETVPFYGSSRLCKPIDRLGADLVVHGHSHHGTHRGATPRGIPVYNVAARLLDAPFIIIELSK